MSQIHLAFAFNFLVEMFVFNKNNLSLQSTLMTVIDYLRAGRAGKNRDDKPETLSYLSRLSVVFF
jgi:hypothetical protein